EYEAGRCEKAKQWFAVAFHMGRLIDSQPDDGAVRVRRARALLRIGRPDEARKELTRAVELKADDMALADVYADLGDWKTAAGFTKAVDSPNATIFTWDDHALLHLRVGDVDGYRKACATGFRTGQIQEAWMFGPDGALDAESLAKLTKMSDSLK